LSKRIMAVDYGDARTGIAISDLTATITGQAWVINNRRANIVAQNIIDAAAAHEVGTIVVGYPKNMNGTIGPRAEKSQQLSETLKELCDLEVVLWDERLTTMDAHRILSDTGKYGKKRKNTVDAVAASLILEGYLGLRSRL